MIHSLMLLMLPHCDTIDGPVAQAARKAIEDVHVLHVLPWVPRESEQEARDAFECVMHAREKGEDARKIADQWFCETIVRLHCVGAGIPYTGLRPAVSDPGPAVHLAEKAMENDDLDELKDFFEDLMEEALEKTMDRVRATAGADPVDADAMRKHIDAKIALLHLADALQCLLSDTGRLEDIRRAETVVKEKLERSYSKRHPFTSETVLRRLS